MPIIAPATSSELPTLLRASPEEGERDLVVRLAGVLAHREHVAQGLGGVPLVGQPVPHRHAGVRRQRLDRSWEKPRYSMASYIRPRTRAVSLTDSL